MVRDVTDDKMLWHLVADGPMLRRWAAHLTGGAKKYAPRNWMKASGDAEYERFRESAFRHFMQWYNGDTDEDHAAAVMFNLNGAEYVQGKMAWPGDEAYDENSSLLEQQLWSVPNDEYNPIARKTTVDLDALNASGAYSTTAVAELHKLPEAERPTHAELKVTIPYEAESTRLPPQEPLRYRRDFRANYRQDANPAIDFNGAHWHVLGDEVLFVFSDGREEPNDFPLDEVTRAIDEGRFVYCDDKGVALNLESL